MSKAYQFPEDPQRPNPFADNLLPTQSEGNNPYAAPQGPATQGAYGEYYQTTPHRGGMLLAMGIIGVLGVLLSLPFAFCCMPLGAGIALLNFGLTVPAWLLSRNDMKALQAGALDPSGRGVTQAAFILGLCGTIGNAISIVIAAGLFSAFYFAD